MRVLVLTQHFTPEVTAARFRLEPFVEAIVRRGHRVEVVCAVPNHPRGVIEEPYRGRAIARRVIHGARVTYVWVHARPRKTTATRLGNYGTYAAMSVLVGALRSGPDVVLASSPPLSVGAVGRALALRHRVPWVLDVRDLWPQSAVVLGEISNESVIRWLERLERRLYLSADSILTVNEAFRGHIAQHVPDPAKIHLVPNGTTSAWIAAGGEAPDRESLGLPAERFVWAYAGNLGLAHGLEHAVDATGQLGDDFMLLIIGDGPRRAELERRAAAGSGRVELRPLMSPDLAARHLRAADALLISERQEQTVPSKLYDYCALGRPVVAACTGELRRVIDETEVALPVPHGDVEALASSLRRLRADGRIAEALTNRGREFARLHLRESQGERLAELLESIAARAG